jgi:hypothetical protein
MAILALLLVAGCSAVPTLEAAPEGADLVLVEAGRPRAVIVVSGEAAEAIPTLDETKANPATQADRVAWAARDLQHYLEKMSGAELPIVPAGGEVPAGTRILVGRSKLTAGYDAEIPSGLTNLREEEGYAILTDGDTLVLAGNDEGPYHGTEYAVSFFLHRLGVRWYMPGEFGEVIPERPTVAVGEIHEIGRPDFKMREWWAHWFAEDLRPTERRWKIHNGMNLARMHSVPGTAA